MVKSIIQKGANFLMKTQNTIISAAAVLAVTYGFSAILSLVRARILAHYFGASAELGVFYTADRIPSFIYSILVVGTLSTVFIPVFAGILKTDEKAAWRSASSLICISLILFTFLGSIVFIFSENIVNLLSLGKFTKEDIYLGSNLMRIMLFAQLVLILSSFVTGILQSFKYFIIPALAPIFYNIGMIFGVVFLVPKMGIYAPAVGVVLGAVFHLLVQIPLIKKVKINFSVTLNLKDKGLRDTLVLMPPRIFGVAASQILATINNSLAILISTSSVVVFKFADQLQSFPVNLIGASIALAALPTLSFESDNESKEEFKETFLASFHQMLFMVIPLSVIFLVLRVPVVRLVYGASKFPWEATIQTAYTLGFFSFSIFAQSSVYLITRAFYALKDTATPVKVSFFTIVFSILTSVFFVKILGLGVWSIALSYSLASVADMFVMLFLLSKVVGGFDFKSVVMPFIKISYSAAFMGLSLYLPMKFLDIYVLDTTRTLNLLILTFVACIVGFISYVFFTHLFKVEEVSMLYKLLKRLNLRIPLLPVVSERTLE